MGKLSSYVVAAIVLVALALCPVAARADSTAVYLGSSGVYSASAMFYLSGNTLTVTLTNTSSADVLVPTDVLTGLFFDATHGVTPVSANLNGSSVYYGTLTNVGDGWGYGSGLSAQGKNSAISATGAVNGLGHSNFSGANNHLDGLDYGLLSKGDNTNTGNGGLHGPLILDSAQFVLTTANGFTLNELGNTVVFQYGTALTDRHYNGTLQPVPEPPVTALLSCSVLLFGGLFRRFHWSLF